MLLIYYCLFRDQAELLLISLLTPDHLLVFLKHFIIVIKFHLEVVGRLVIMLTILRELSRLLEYGSGDLTRVELVATIERQCLEAR